MLIQITDPFLLPDGTNWTGTIIYTLLYATTLDGATVVGAQQALQVTDGISVQLAPGLYNVQLNQSGLREVYTAQWGVPVSGGPYTVAEISSNVSLQGSFGAVTLTGTPTTGQVPTATSGTAATWQTPAGGGGSFLNQTTTLTNSQVLALNATPQDLIAAPGANTVILPFYITAEMTGNPTYSSGDETLVLKIGTNIIANWATLGPPSVATYLVNDGLSGGGVINGDASLYANQPLTVSADATVTGSGTGITFTVYYVLQVLS